MTNYKMSKCPSCGYEYTPSNKTTEIRRLEFSRPTNVRHRLSMATKGIMKYVPSDNKKYKHYAFLYGIKNIDDEPLKWATNIFLNREEYKTGKGFAYLRTMIQNASKDMKVKKEGELRMKGKTPMSINKKREVLGYDK